jgi:hypothetical protein
MKIQILLALLALSICANAFAGEIQLFRITSNIFAGEKNVSISVDQNNAITEFSYTPQSRIPHRFSIAEAAAPAGVVLDREKGHDAVTLNETGFTANQGGAITLTYLRNGLTGATDTFVFEVRPVGSTWQSQITKEDGSIQKFKEMWLEKNSILGRLLGIKSISVE